jgi:hypothetical protein
MMRMLVALLGALLLSGCQAADPLSAAQDPHSPWWGLGFTGPSYMLGEVEESIVEDINGRLFQRPGGGAVGTGDPDDGTESARGWGGMGGGGMHVLGADLPKRIFVRWQSVVELKTYRAWVEIPEEARQIMRKATTRRCHTDPDSPSAYDASLNLGLAPGGIVQVWVRDECHRPVKVARAQAEIEPLGPDQGNNEGRYAYKISENTKRYIERFGIPYGSW